MTNQNQTMDNYEAMSEDESLSEIRANQAHLREIISFGQAVTRLADNADFKAVFMEHLFKREPVRLATMLASPQLTDRDHQMVTKDIEAIGNLMNRLSEWSRATVEAENSLAYLDETLAEYQQAQQKI